MSSIGNEISRRGITRLCHFTPLTLLDRIISDHEILSNQELMSRGQAVCRNDNYRHDGHLDYISCSVQFPNLFVLDRFRQRSDLDDSWVVALLDPHLLELSSTRFSPVNAATDKGIHVSDGFEGFDAMFRQNSPSKYGIKRPTTHRKSCPTDLQAEVLIQRSVSANSIIGLVCETDDNLQQVQQLLLNWTGTPPVCSTRPHFFEQSYVRDLVRSGHDICIAVRED